jgi:hypothetical protein
MQGNRHCASLAHSRVICPGEARERDIGMPAHPYARCLRPRTVTVDHAFTLQRVKSSPTGVNGRRGISAAPDLGRPANGNVGGRPAAYTERTLNAARPPCTAFGARSPAYRGPGAETPPGMARNACPLRPDMGALRDHHPPESGFVDFGDTIMRLWRPPGSKANIISAWSAVALLESGVSARPRTSPRRWRRCGRAR